MPLAGSDNSSSLNDLPVEMSRHASVEAKREIFAPVPPETDGSALFDSSLRHRIQTERLARLHALSYATAATIARLAYGVVG